jgi:hypothetical protein
MKMADNYLITGYWGSPHVTAENDRGIQGGIVGAGRYVLPVGNQFRAEYIGDNFIRMYDGKLMDNGTAAGIPAGEYMDIPIANAGQGMQRHDLIVFQYSRDNSTMVESGSFIVLQGEEVANGAADPALTQADLLTGDVTRDQMALWRIVVSGVNIAAPVKLFEVSKALKDVCEVDHEHGNLTNDGKIGTTTGRIITTGTGGKLEASTPAAAREKLGLAVDNTVTTTGSNAVSGAAVASYVAAQLAAITDYEGSEF